MLLEVNTICHKYTIKTCQQPHNTTNMIILLDCTLKRIIFADSRKNNMKIKSVILLGECETF